MNACDPYPPEVGCIELQWDAELRLESLEIERVSVGLGVSRQIDTPRLDAPRST
jgi:hypothetical protein